MGLDLRHIGWKSYNLISKKAMEQEFSWTGLSISLFIAFFIVFASAQALSMIYFSRESGAAQAQEESAARAADSSAKTRQSLFSADYWREAAIPRASAASEEEKGRPERVDYFLDLKWNSAASHSVKIKNTGQAVWLKGKVFLETGPYLRSISPFRHENWLNYYRLAGLAKDVFPGETAEFNFTLKGPANIEGLVQQNIQLVAGEKIIAGTAIRLFITVIKPGAILTAPAVSASAANAAAAKPDFCIASVGNSADYANCNTDAKETDNSDGLSESAVLLPAEPIIRVGLYNTKYAQRAVADSAYDIFSGQELLFSNLPANQTAIVGFDFNTKKYSVTAGGVAYYRDSYIRLVPKKKNSVFTLLDFERRVKWNTNLNDNQFRNIIEFRYSAATGNFWAINELPIESYLAGLGETTNYSPVEFQKVMAVAARTYAMYHYNRGLAYNIGGASTKHASEYFHVDSVYDQVYLGYGSEKRMSRLIQAINETRGAVIAYDNKVVVTPYFSRSDGHTRDWVEVWGGQAKPWLKSVAVVEDQGEALWGHGVGMSARAALIMTRDKGVSWQNTLKYFYAGTDLKKIYK